MLTEIYTTILVNPILNVLIFLYHTTGSLGVSIILLTIFIRLILLPVVIPSMRSMKKQQELRPELEKIKKKYKNDKKKQAEAQMELFKKHGISPASGCLTQIPMIVVLIAVFSVIRQISTAADISDINAHLYFDSIKITAEYIGTKFLYLDLAKADHLYIIPILAGIFQFLSSKLTVGFNSAASKVAEKTPDKTDDIAYNVQKQMIYTMPVMTVIIGASLPSGVALYILATSIFSLAQAYVLLGGEDRNKVVSSILSKTWKK